MDTTRLSNWLTLAANIGVIAGIVFLAFEIRQSNRIALVANETDIRKSYADFTQAIFTNRESAELVARAYDPDAEFDAVEVQMLTGYVWTLMNIWLAVEIGYDNGMLPRQTYDEMENDIRENAKSLPAIHSTLRQELANYPAGRDSDVYRILNEALSETNR